MNFILNFGVVLCGVFLMNGVACWDNRTLEKRQITINGGDLEGIQQSLGSAINQAAPLVQGLLQGLFNPAGLSNANNQQPFRRPGLNPANRPGPPFQQNVGNFQNSNTPLPPPPPPPGSIENGPNRERRRQNCRRYPNSPRCRAAAGSGIPPELALAPWASNVQGSLLVLPAGVPSPQGFNNKRSYNLGFNSPNIAFQTCFTPKGRAGRCRLVQYCSRRRIISSLENLLSYACPVSNDIMGVCCPEDVFGTGAAGSRPVASGATSVLPSQTPQQPVGPAEPSPSFIDTIDVRITTGKSCGIFYRRTKRVVGGQVSTVSEWTWVAALIRKQVSQRCGGVLVGPKHVLTAANCVNTIRLSDLKVRFGDYNFTKTASEGRDFAAEDIILHEDFNRFTLDNNVALIRLTESPVSSGQVTVPVCLPAPSLLLDEQDAFVIGLSKVSATGGTSVDVVQEIVLPLWKTDECQTVITESIPESKFCAGYTVGGSDSCGGDLGGPLMLQLDSGNWVVIGINQGCGPINKPGIFTKISPYVDWIKTNTV